MGDDALRFLRFVPMFSRNVLAIGSNILGIWNMSACSDNEKKSLYVKYSWCGLQSDQQPLK